ncbi:unnamed protein product [Psylliodes chrysocephalus]|uniref:Regulatory protein zeste n=1 Tax=Psylliodes chrysocephalus TaxID=3402493 RepID=A0A9P0CW17_9CUCU|nr:unnamed protein product [Psylliodes chrysocephala]
MYKIDGLLLDNRPETCSSTPFPSSSASRPLFVHTPQASPSYSHDSQASVDLQRYQPYPAYSHDSQAFGYSQHSQPPHVDSQHYQRASAYAPSSQSSPLQVQILQAPLQKAHRSTPYSSKSIYAQSSQPSSLHIHVLKAPLQDNHRTTPYSPHPSPAQIYHPSPLHLEPTLLEGVPLSTTKKVAEEKLQIKQTCYRKSKGYCTNDLILGLIKKTVFPLNTSFGGDTNEIPSNIAAVETMSDQVETKEAAVSTACITEQKRAISKAKKLRGANTAVVQYEEYVKFLENDEIFRTGTINPSVAENYIKQKWEELTTKLNAKSKGPQLNTDKWIQRFSDWKHSTRFKYRKYLVNKNKTGGGPEVKNPLSSLEERAINAWGKVVVEGSSLVPDCIARLFKTFHQLPSLLMKI